MGYDCFRKYQNKIGRKFSRNVSFAVGSMGCTSPHHNSMPKKNVIMTGGDLSPGLGFEGEIFPASRLHIESVEEIAMTDEFNFEITNLGERKIPSPLTVGYFKTDDDRILFNTYLKHFEDFTDAEGRPLSMEVAGPRKFIYFDPSKAKAAIVTCGGLSLESTTSSGP